MKVISWNLLHKEGANAAEIARLIERERPDMLLMQEAREAQRGITALVGGSFEWAPLPGRVHGLAAWTPQPQLEPARVVPIPSGALVRRVCQIVTVDDITFANVHLSHGQLLNRRQLRHIIQVLPQAAAVIGDYNMVGPAMLSGFHDVGPRLPTHRMSRMMPLRLDRCLIRALACKEAAVLTRGGSDHHPIMLQLERL